MTIAGMHTVTFGHAQRRRLLRLGFTLPQMALVLVVAGLLWAVAVPRFGQYQDQLSVRAAAFDVVSALSRARNLAVERNRRAAVTFDTAARTLAVQSFSDTVEFRPLGELYGVYVSATRDSVTYAPNAMGFGVSNTRLIVSRGASADTITVSRLGRVKR